MKQITKKDEAEKEFNAQKSFNWEGRSGDCDAVASSLGVRVKI